MLPKCRWQSENLAVIQRDDSDLVCIAHISLDGSQIVYSLWTPCLGRDYWTKREIFGVLYGQVGAEWPPCSQDIEAAYAQIRWLLTDEMWQVLHIAPDADDLPICVTECSGGCDIEVYVNVLTDIEHIVRDYTNVRTLERMVQREKVMA